MFKPKPSVKEVTLNRTYQFSYENFVLATQGSTYLFLEKSENSVFGIKFNSRLVKYGSPNDEARGGHPLTKYGLGFYGFFEVENSDWVREQIELNSVHPRHNEKLFEGYKHYVACFQDVMLEVTSKSYVEFEISLSELNALIQEQVNFIEQ
ncbi:hypothetical protein [Cellvibrio sp. NN19]|uniref:hypothetical protein n=1 Tax=Cellvibrio chitinivorans TaxID=3102792 RepID=UPI002B415956|nr:hypothetical protein [Cellvibrio sp. NN19]